MHKWLLMAVATVVMLMVVEAKKFIVMMAVLGGFILMIPPDGYEGARQGKCIIAKANNFFDGAADKLSSWYYYLFGYDKLQPRMNSRPLIRPTKNRRSTSVTRFLCMVTILAAAHASSATPDKTSFDTESYKIGIDSRTSACISDVKSDFEPGTLRKTNRVVTGFGGKVVADIMKGTLRWRINDDYGNPTTFLIPNSYYIPQGKVRLLSPQHLAQAVGDKDKSGTGCITTADTCILFWNGSTRQRTIPIDEANVFTIYSSEGFGRYEDYSTAVGDDEGILCYDVEEGEAITDGDSDECQQELPFKDTEPDELVWPDKNSNNAVEFNLQQLPSPSELGRRLDMEEAEAADVDPEDNEQQPTPSKATDLFKWYHERLNHLPPEGIRRMAVCGIIPKQLAKCEVPACKACLYGKAKRKAWRTRAAPSQIKPVEIKNPGDCVSVDQMESRTPGLVAHMKGKNTKKRYAVATVFVDHASRLSYVHLQSSTNGEETLQAKMAFETYARQHGVTVKHYHCDNGRFADNLWKESCKAKGQSITYCSVNAHHQNAVCERRIQELVNRARSALLHAHDKWPTAITANLWPYALRLVNDTFNDTPQKGSLRSPMEIFSGGRVQANIKHYHHFGSPDLCFGRNTSSRREDK